MIHVVQRLTTPEFVLSFGSKHFVQNRHCAPTLLYINLEENRKHRVPKAFFVYFVHIVKIAFVCDFDILTT